MRTLDAIVQNRVVRPLRIVVMGVAASGKTTLARALSTVLRAEYLEADDLHPAANVEKMASGIPLTDEDRWPWLAAIRDALARSDRVVVTCSALKRSYRDLLREAGSVRFVYLHIERELAEARIAGRSGHFMTARMIESQFATLEVPTPDETDVVRLDADHTIAQLVAGAEAALGRDGDDENYLPHRPDRPGAKS